VIVNDMSEVNIDASLVDRSASNADAPYREPTRSWWK